MKRQNKLIRKAIRFDTVPKVEEILAANFQSNCFLEACDTPAHYAAQYGRLDVLELLLRMIDSKCCLNVTKESCNSHGKRPIHEACQYGHRDCVEFLIYQKVQLDPLKVGDWTPLMLACTQDDVGIVNLLLRAGADPSLRNKDGWTCFHIACRHGKIDVVKCLIDGSPHPLWLTVSNNGRTPLHTAALHGHLDIVEWMVTNNYAHNSDTPDNCGTTPLMDAIRSSHVTVATYLIDYHKADPEGVDKLGRRCLHLAAQVGTVVSLRYLVECCHVQIDVQSADGNTPLSLAASEGHSEIVKWLVQRGADVTIKDIHSRTARDVACIRKNWAVVSCLDDL